jgi:hypothetical protein
MYINLRSISFCADTFHLQKSFFLQLYRARQDINKKFNKIIEPLSRFNQITTAEEIMQILKNCFREFLIILNVLRIWDVRVTAWAVEILDEDNNK